MLVYWLLGWLVCWFLMNGYNIYWEDPIRVGINVSIHLSISYLEVGIIHLVNLITGGPQPCLTLPEKNVPLS